MDELIGLMNDSDLLELKDKYSTNPSVVTLIDGILEGRANTAREVEAKAKFESGIAKLFTKLPHPEDVNNVFVRWGKVEVPDTTKDAEEVEVVETPAKVKDGEIVEDAVMKTETRYPMLEVYQWIVEVNARTAKLTGDTSSGGSQAPSKRAIKVFKRDGLELVDKGNYASASKACEALGLTIGGDSATRVLARDGFIVEPYTGTDVAS